MPKSGTSFIDRSVSMAGLCFRSLASLKRLTFVGAFLALLALANASSLNTWHLSDPGHSDSSVVSVLAEDTGRDTLVPEVDLHKAAHSIVSGLADPWLSSGGSMMPYARAIFRMTLGDYVHRGLAPEALLRPPRD